MTATREAFGKALAKLAEKNPDVIVLDADLSAATKTSYVKDIRPEQFYTAGIAEANMVGMGAGLAAQGLKPYVASFAMFLAGRAFEQVRNSVAYPRLNVKLCATHAGITVGEDGGSHQAIEDISLMRTLPGMVVLQPADAAETAAMLEFMNSYNGPVYLRTSRMSVPDLYDENYRFELGAIPMVREGKQAAILASGVEVHEALKAARHLEKEGIEAAVYNVSTIKPLNTEALEKILQKYPVIVTAEEHLKAGGLYSEILEETGGRYPVEAVAIEDEFGQSGSPAELMHYYKIDADAIADKVRKALH